MIACAKRWQPLLAALVFLLCTMRAQSQTVIDTLNQSAQTPADGQSLTVTGTGSIVTAGSRAVLGAGNNTITVNAPTVTGGGAIEGAARGIDINNAPGTIDNSGLINGTSTTSIGVDLGAGGSVTNRTGASISGGSTAVLGAGTSATVTVVNDGQISGGTGDGVSLQGGGTVGNTGNITGTLSAIRIQNGASAGNTVTNSGTLQSATTGFDSAVQFNGVGGSVDNQAGGVISAAGGINIGGAGVVQNSGQISGTNSNAVSISGGGSVTNSAAGIISSTGGAISITGAAGTVENSGSVSSTGSFAVSMSAGGTVTNNNSITGGVIVSGGSSSTNALENGTGASIVGGILTGASLSAGGDLTNHGSITGASGVNIGGTTTLINTGTIRATGAFGTGASVGSGSTVDNAGSITSDSASAVNLGIGSTMTTITNQTGGEIIGGAGGSSDAISVGSSFMIDNDGLIRGQGTSLFFDPGAIFGSGVAGTVINRKNGIIENQLSGGAIEFLGTAAQTLDNAGTINGNVNLDNGSDVVLLRPGSSINGTLNAGAGSDRLEFIAPTGITGTLDFDVTTVTGFDGENGSKTGEGTWTLAGTNTTFSPDFTVAAGTLIVNSTTPGLAPTVQTGAAIGGTGTVGGVVNNGTVSPGNSIGTLQVSGDATFNTGSTYTVEVANDGGRDLLDVTGTTAINGGTVSVIPVSSEDSYVDGQRFTIITSAVRVTGAFTGVTDLSAFLDFELSYDLNNVYLTLAKTADFASVARTFNQLQVAGALQDLDISTGSDGNAVAAVLLGLDADSARSAYDSIQGEVHADVQLMGADIGALFNSVLMRQAAASGTGSAAGAVTRSAYAAERVAQSFDAVSPFSSGSGGRNPLPGTRLSVWGGGYGASAEVDGDGNAGEWSSDAAGFATGFEFDVSDLMPRATIVGIGAGYTHATGKIASRSQATDIDSYHLGLYGRIGAARSEAGFSARAAMSYAYQQIRTSRNIAFTGISRTANADYDGHAFSMAAELRHGFALAETVPGLPGHAMVSPLVQIEGRFFTHDGFAETGASSINLSSGGDDFGQGSLIAGVSISGNYSTDDINLRPFYTVAYERLIGEAMPAATLALAGSPTGFSVRGPNESRNRFRLDAALEAGVSDRTALHFSIGSVVSADRSDVSANAMFRIRF